MRVLFLYNEVESVGIQYLSAALRHAGHETGLVFDPRLFDFFRVEYNNRLLAKMLSFEKDVIRRVEEFQPDVVGFQMLTANSGWCSRRAQAIRERLPNVKIIAGGYHATANAEEVLRSGPFDDVIRGEADVAIVEYVNSLADGAIDRSMENLAYVDEHGRYVENPLRPYEQDLDRYPRPDKDLFYRLGGPFQIGLMQEWHRGCPWGCTFCGNNYYRKIYFGDRKDYMFTREFLRSRSVDDVLAELRDRKARYNPRLMRVNDDDLCADEAWLAELAEKMTDAERIPYKCFAIPNNINERTIEYLKQTGCEQIQMGVQSLNPDIRKMIGRPNSDKQIAKAIDLCREHGIGLYVDQIFGLPGETEEDCKKIESFYGQHTPDVVSIYWLDLWSGHDVLEQAVQAGTIKQETADTLKAMHDHRDISTIRNWHNEFSKPYARRMEVNCGYPPRLARAINKTGLWRVFGRPVFLSFMRGMYALRYTFKPDHFPPARHAYDLAWARFPRYMVHFVGMRIRSWLGRGTKLPLITLPPIGVPYEQRPKTGQQEPLKSAV